MLNVRKRVDGIPIFDTLDRPLYHLDSDSEQKSNKYVMVVDEINSMDGRFLELKDCLKEKYEKIDIYTNSPLSKNSFTIEDQYSIKSVLNWINKSVWNSKKKEKSIKINKSKSKYNGPVNKEIPLIIRLFKFKANKDVEMNTIRCNVYTEEVDSTEKENKLNKKSKKLIKTTEIKKKQNKKKPSSPKPNLLCLPIKQAKFNWLKKKENKNINSNMSIDEFQFQNTDISSFLPIKANNIFEHNDKLEVKTEKVCENEVEVSRINSLKRVSSSDLSRRDSKKRMVTNDISGENNNNKNEPSISVKSHEVKNINKNKQNLQSLVIPQSNSLKSRYPYSARNLSASTLVNDQFDYPKYQEPTSYLPSPCCSTASTLVSPVETPAKVNIEPKFEIDSCDYADYLKDKLNEKNNSEINEIERKHFSLPVSPENIKNGKGRRRSYAFSLTSNELNLIYSEANQVVISELCNTVENKQKDHYSKNDNCHHQESTQELQQESYQQPHKKPYQLNQSFSLSPKQSLSSESNGKPFVKGHNRTQSRHRRSHAVCLSSDQIFNFENPEEDVKQNRRKSRFNRESSGASLSTYAILNSNSSKNTTNKDTQLKRRSTNMIKYKNSNSSLSSTTSSNRNSYCSNSGSIRPISNNRLSRDIELLRAMKMKRSRSVPKLDQVETSSPRSPTKSRYSMDASTYKENLGISLRTDSTSSHTPQSNIVYYYFNNKENKNNAAYEGIRNVNKSNNYGLFTDAFNQSSIANRWSNVFDNSSSSCGSSTYYYSEEDNVHNNNINNKSLKIVNSKEELLNYESANRSFNDCLREESSKNSFTQLAPPTPAIGMI